MDNMGEIMSDDNKPSIAELQQVYDAMPKGQWTLSSDDGARAAVRLLRATPLLLEAVAAALAYQKAKKIAARTRERLARMAFPDDLSRESEKRDNEELRCRGAFVAALAMVRK